MVEWVSSKSLQIINAREGVEKWKHSYNTGGNVNWRNHYGKQYGGSLKKNPWKQINPMIWQFPPWYEKSESESPSVTSNSLWPHGLQPARLLCPWDSPGKNTWVDCHALLQGIFPSHRSNPNLLVFCLGRGVLYYWHHLGSLQTQYPKASYWLFVCSVSNSGDENTSWYQHYASNIENNQLFSVMPMFLKDLLYFEYRNIWFH